LVAYALAAVLTLWTANAFNVGAMSPDLPVLPGLSGRTLPLANHLEQLLDIGGRLRVSTPSFLLGQYSDSGWWYYFPVAFLLKTPLPTLILFAWGAVVYLVCILRRDRACPAWLDSAALLIPGLGYFAIALTTDINLGYRHILPALPFLIAFAATAVSRFLETAFFQQTRFLAAARFAPAGLAAWLTLANLLIYPHYLAYFNSLAGGADGGWRSLVDSNLDWGQDLDDLAPWMADNGVDEVWLSYFGEARPEYYGIKYRGLDSFPPRLMNPQARPFYAPDPAPGVYAISATNLQGVHFADHDQFAWFREQDPIDKLGYSIFLYRVPARGETADLVLAGLQLDQLPAQASAHLNTNDVRPRWIDPGQSLILPAGTRAWLARPSDLPVHFLLAPYLEGSLVETRQYSGVELARIEKRPAAGEALARFSTGDGRVSLASALLKKSDSAGLTLLTTWEQEGQPQPLLIFVHALDEDSRIISQWDGLGAAWEGWLEGDVLLQVHELALAQEERKQLSKLAIGVYDPRTGTRWQTESAADHLEIALDGANAQD
jgi:hypothetical protein